MNRIALHEGGCLGLLQRDNITLSGTAYSPIQRCKGTRIHSERALQPCACKLLRRCTQVEMHALTDSLQATRFLAANLYYTYRFVHAYSVLMLCAFTVLRVESWLVISLK